jgi:electron transport complex protein RnfB
MSDKKFDLSELKGEKKTVDRRDFIKTGLRAAAFLSIGSVTGYILSKSMSDELVWQLDPNKCVQCGRCATECVLTQSAVKCVHIYKMCGYCNLCGGYFKPQVKDLTTAAENQLCPTKALKRVYVEEPYYKYEIDEDLCNGCGKCVEGCGAFGNGSLHLQVSHDICDNCNQCSIAAKCPADAFERIPSNQAYILKSGWNTPTENSDDNA